MGTSVLHIKTEVECRVYLFDEEKGIAKPDIYFNLEVRKGEQDLLFVSTKDESVIYFKSYNVEEDDCNYRMTLDQSQFINFNSPATEEEISSGVKDGFGVIYSYDGLELLKCFSYDIIKTCKVKEGCKVIRSSAFSGCMFLTAITLPASLKRIGGSAFFGCMFLTAVTLPASLTHIGDSAFYKCESLTSITLPASLTHIGDSAFYGCESLADITLPASLTYIGDSVFFGCNNLTAIIFPACLMHIGDWAFSGCSKLSAITLPASLMHIGRGAFSRSGIRFVVNQSPHFSFQYGCLIDMQGRSLIAFLSDDEEVTLPTGLTHIGDSAFSNCNNITAITLPVGLTHIGYSAFSNCYNLTVITLPASLTHIGDRAFGRCKNLTAITLPASLTHIWYSAFDWCKNITAIHIPQGMREHFKALLPPYFHSKLKEPDDFPFW